MSLLAAFETGNINAAAFTHRAHVEVGAEMLAQTSFLDAAQRYQNGIARIAARAGAAQKANVTITLAFLSLIAERLSANSDLAAHPELFDATLLTRWYSKERLTLPEARTAFLMPDRTPQQR